MQNLTSIQQKGVPGETARTRSFSVNGLSQLLSTTNPETGTVTYTYTRDGGFCSSESALPCSKTDARGFVISYDYDALNRMQHRYFNGVLDTEFNHDQPSQWGNPLSNTVGRLSSAITYLANGKVNATLYNYDTMGRPTTVLGVLPSENGSGHATSRTYDLAGNVTRIDYPFGLFSVAQDYDGAGRLYRVRNANDSDAAHDMFHVNSFLPDGTPSEVRYGNGIVETLAKNNRLQPCRSTIFSGNATLLQRNYFYGLQANANGSECGSASSNNGNIAAINDALNSDRNQVFQYDALNRITQWNTAMGGQLQKQTFSYDSFGNMLQKSGYGPQPPYGNPLSSAAWDGSANWPYDSENQLTAGSFHCVPLYAQGSPGSVKAYDAAGNLLCTGTQNQDARAYEWGAEGRVTRLWGQQNNNAYIAQADYFYDEDGNRILANQYDSAGNKSSYREYIYSVGQMLTEKENGATGTNYVSYFYAQGKRFASFGQKENVIQVAGSYSGGWIGVGISPPAPALAGYVFRAGDVLLVRQRKFGANVHGGILIFGDGVGSFFNDQDGQRADDDLLGDGTWHNRRISLDPLGGKTYSGLGIGGGTSTDYTFQFASIAVASTDGTVRTVFNGTADASTVSVPAGTDSVHFYAGDHLGTAQLELDAAGNPLWRGDFAPFGQEIDPNPTQNHYKFTGKERDAESGLDYFGARYYTSNLGRWMSPDWADKPEAVPYSDLTNPQSLNLYGYVRNNPLSKADPDGHCPWCAVFEEVEASPAGQAVVNAVGTGITAGLVFGTSMVRDIISAGNQPGGYVPGGMTRPDGSSVFQTQHQEGGSNASGPNSSTPSSAPNEPDGPYKRPSNATTREQRDSVQGKPCSTCGATGQKNNADHKDPLVEQHYRGGVNSNKMRSPDAVRPQCPTCSAQQGGYLRQFSNAMRKLFKLE